MAQVPTMVRRTTSADADSSTDPSWRASAAASASDNIDGYTNLSGPRPRPRRLNAGLELCRAGDADAEVTQQSVVEAVDPAVNAQRLVASPGILHDGYLTDVDRLRDHIELAQPRVARRFRRQGAQLG